ncbi:MAG: hypothetical protein ACKV2T_01185 [Kofleriaceae bacterium]
MRKPAGAVSEVLMRTGSLLLVMLAFETAAAQPSRPPPPPGDDGMHDGAVVEPPPCTVFAELVPIVSGRTASLRVVLKNTARTPTTVTLEGPCGARYAVRGEPRTTCPPSPCRAAPPKTYTIGAMRSLTLGTLPVKSKGDACREPMPNGSTLFEAVVTSQDRHVCSGAKVHVIKDARSGRLRKAKPTDPLVEPSIPAPTPTSPSTLPPKAPKPCPACGIGCPRGRPSSAVDANGCRVCACEDFPRPAPAPKTAPPPSPTTPTTPTTTPTTPRTPPKKSCPACAMGCPNGVPSSAVDANGCPVCACEDFSRPTPVPSK